MTLAEGESASDIDNLHVKENHSGQQDASDVDHISQPNYLTTVCSNLCYGH